MLLSTRIKVALALWFAAEAIVFALIARLIGFPEALLLAFVTSLFGWTLLKRAGASAIVKLRASLDGRVARADSQRFLDDTLATVGALALLMPGFLSDLAGLILAVPAARDRVSQWIGTRGIAGVRPGRAHAERGPSTIDLDPHDWDRSDRPRSPISKF
jgi:UPF0716 protein FxsA